MPSVKPLPQPIKGNADWRQYRSFQLENGVTCTVVHDKESKTTAAAAVVDAGAGSDPRSLSGTAHFCEHMLFLGSKEYPGENEYKSFLSAHGGRSNASTSLHTTTYKFEVLSDYGEKAFDIFSNFFISPLFSASGVSREVQAVDSENSKNLTNDARRRLQVLKALADKGHYFSKFSTGNSITLPTVDDEKLELIRGALLAFHRKHYHPGNICVVVAGPQSLDTLEDWVVSRFSKVEAWSFPKDVEQMTPIEKEIHDAAKDAPNYAFHKPPPPYQPAFRPEIQGGWPILLTTRPLKSYRKLNLMFQLPSDRKNPDQSPIHVLSHLLGHEGPGSAFSILQDYGLISNLVAGPRVSGPDFCLFNVEMNLTKEGEEKWKQVADIVFAHCRLIYNAAMEAKSENSSELHRIWDEVAALRAIFFDQNSPGGVYDFCPNLVGSILMNGTEKCLSSGSMLNENTSTLPLDQILDFSSRLIITNCILERCSHDAWSEMEKNEESIPHLKRQTEQWYGVDYFLSKIDAKEIELWTGLESKVIDHLDRTLLHLPGPNRYIPRSLELCPDLPEEAKRGPRIEKEIDPPNLVLHNGIGRLWHRLDDRYALPKSSLTFLIRNAAVENIINGGVWEYEVNSSVHSSMLSGMFSEAMAQDTYDADLAGLHWNLAMTSSGIRLSCNGFSDRLSDLALTILREFLTGSFLQEHYFNNAKDRLIRNLSTYFESRRSDSIAVYYRDLVIASNEHGIDKSLEAAKSITLESARQQYKRLVQNAEANVDCLYSGNVSEEKAKDFFSEATRRLEEARDAKGSSPLQDGHPWIPGPIEQRLLPGDTELHFPSNNPNEENGAVLVTFQSSIPGYRGEGLSPKESLRSTAALRLLCQMLREPLFDELRTKQQLGYIVHSYYDLSFSTPRRVESDFFHGTTTPVDFLVVSVLSRKVPPPEVRERIDDFLEDFRSTLVNMPESSIAEYASALQTKLLKPIQKLSVETNNHYGKIRRFAPEVLAKGGTGKDLPWNNAKPLARAVGNLTRKDLIGAWDRLTQTKTRSRITSHVYGSTHPLANANIRGAPSRTIVDSVPSLMEHRSSLRRFDGTMEAARNTRIFLALTPKSAATGLAAVAVVFGIGYIGLSMFARVRKVGNK